MSRRGLWGMLLPYLLGLVALVLAPAVITFAMSLYEWDLLTPPRYRGLGNFRDLAADPVFRISLANSLGFAAWAVPLRVLGALALALLLHRRFRGVGLYRTAAWVPTVVPDIAWGLVWLWILNPLYGPMNLLLEAVGLGPRQWLNDPAAAQQAVVLMSLFTIGEGFLVALATRQEVPVELEEVSSVEGAGGFYTFRRVILPLMAPTLLLLLFRDTVFSFQVSFVPALVVTEGGPPPYATTYLPLFVYRTAFEYFRYGYAAAATLVMFGVTAAIVAAQWLVVRRWRRAFLL
jgi:multiple sugar transport system permease protein